MTIEYMGMSYEQASREADRLIERFGWLTSFERLQELRQIMMAHYFSDEPKLLNLDNK